MLDAATRDLVRATAPVLQEAGVALMDHFYQRLLSHQPEMKVLFNEAHLGQSEQQTALARAATAYAQNIDNPQVLGEALRHIANKHASLGVRPEHYPIIGEHLLTSLREVLGSAASEELIAAWGAAYGELANFLIDMEGSLYRDGAHRHGGISGWRRFGVGKKEDEGEGMVSFYLYPADGAPVPDFLPGQYISLRGLDSNWSDLAPRQFSLSKAPNGHYLRITVKREDSAGDKPAGKATTLMYQHLQRGDEVEISTPYGDFTLRDDPAPAVLIGAGIGLTPLLAMLEARAQQGRQTVLVQACRHGGQHPLCHSTQKLLAEYDCLRSVVFYSAPRAEDVAGQDYQFSGRVDLARAGVLGVPGAHYYLCGPVGFMQELCAALRQAGVTADHLHHEVFGPDLLPG